MVGEVQRAPVVKGSLSGLALAQEQAHVVGEILGRIETAARGRLLAGNRDEFEAVRQNPGLWEHKWKKTRLGEFRLYHAEPATEPGLVLLRFHRKELEPRDGLDIDKLQERCMDEAQDRYDDGADSAWGHVETACAQCHVQ